MDVMDMIGLYVKVGDWQRVRAMTADLDEIFMDVYKNTCVCPTCLARMRHVRGKLSDKGVRSREITVGDLVSVVIPRPANIPLDASALAEYMGQLLDVPVVYQPGFNHPADTRNGPKPDWIV